MNKVVEEFISLVKKNGKIVSTRLNVDTNYYDGSSLSFLKNSKLVKEQAGFLELLLPR